MTKWLTYERAREVVDYDPETGVIHRRDGKPEPYGGYVRLPASGEYRDDLHSGYNFIEIDGHRFWVHTIVDLIRRGSGRVKVWTKPKPHLFTLVSTAIH